MSGRQKRRSEHDGGRDSGSGDAVSEGSGEKGAPETSRYRSREDRQASTPEDWQAPSGGEDGPPSEDGQG